MNSQRRLYIVRLTFLKWLSIAALGIAFTNPPTPNRSIFYKWKQRVLPQYVLNTGHIDDVEQSLEVLYPTTELDTRNSLSRTDGYWKYIREGKDPPTNLIYGEFDIQFFAEILDRTSHHFQSFATGSEYDKKGWDDRVFADFGSGAGRLVLGAAALYPKWKLCKGIEILPGIHKLAREKLELCRITNDGEFSKTTSKYSIPISKSSNDTPSSSIKVKSRSSASAYALSLQATSNPSSSRFFDESDRVMDTNESCLDLELNTASFDEEIYNNHNYDQSGLPIAPIEFICGSFDDPYVHLGDVDLVFCFSSCFPDGVIEVVSRGVGRCRPGTILVTTDYEPPLEGYLPPVSNDVRVPHGYYRLEKIESIDGACQVVGGQTRAHIYRVAESTWNGKVITRPIF